MFVILGGDGEYAPGAARLTWLAGLRTCADELGDRLVLLRDDLEAIGPPPASWSSMRNARADR